VLHRQSRAKLEQRLTVPLVQLVEDCSSRRGGESFEDTVKGELWDSPKRKAYLGRRSMEWPGFIVGTGAAACNDDSQM
jgi:hypothetical protein